MEGRFRRSGKQLRPSVRLINAVDGFTVWSSVFERKTEDVFAVQEELAQAIVSKLGSKLRAAIGEPAAHGPPKPWEVYHLYLRGRHQWNQLGPESLNRAIECFRQVIGQEPSYAPAHAGLADCHIALADSGYAPPPEVTLKAKQAAVEGIDLDPALAGAHTSLAKVTEGYEWRVTEAESIHLGPSG